MDVVSEASKNTDNGATPEKRDGTSEGLIMSPVAIGVARGGSPISRSVAVAAQREAADILLSLADTPAALALKLTGASHDVSSKLNKIIINNPLAFFKFSSFKITLSLNSIFRTLHLDKVCATLYLSSSTFLGLPCGRYSSSRQTN